MAMNDIGPTFRHLAECDGERPQDQKAEVASRARSAEAYAARRSRPTLGARVVATATQFTAGE
jgi:hypothetical protein